MDLSGFNANDVEPMDSFEPIPAGDYEVVISASEQKQNSARTGSYLALTFEVISGDCEGRKLWTNLNLDNPNETAVSIARRELATICQVVGVTQPRDSSDLHDKPLVVKVVQETRKDSGEKQNRIKGYKAKSGGDLVSAGGSTSNGAASKPATPPWQRNR